MAKDAFEKLIYRRQKDYHSGMRTTRKCMGNMKTRESRGGVVNKLFAAEGEECTRCGIGHMLTTEGIGSNCLPGSRQYGI